MRKLMTYAASFLMAMALLTAPHMAAQTRTSSGSATRSSSSSQSSTRSSSSSSSSSTRSSSSSSGSATRSSSSVSSSRSSSTSSSPSRSSSTSTQDTRKSSGTSTSSATRSSSSTSGSATRSSSSSSATRSSSSSSSSGSAVRSSSSSSSSSTRSSSSSSAVRSSSSSSGSATRSSSSSSGSAVRSSSSSSQSSSAVRSSNVTRAGLTTASTAASDTQPKGDAYRDDGYNYRYTNDYRVDDRHDMYRVAPRHRDPMPWDRPGYFWGDHPHYYGYRIHSIPPSWRHISHWGIDYYVYNGVYYRPFGSAYVICRPPFGTPLEVAIDRALFRAVRFAYYCDTYRTYNAVFDYYNAIARQNLIIAQHNAREAARYANYALNSTRALTSYELANKLGLVQSYAYAGSDYFYQDGVFYTVSASGAYSTIVPPAGALVTSLPDDYEIIVMNGIEYYLVDNTVYRTTVFDGQPFLEVLGQMYGSLYSQYNVYR